MQNKIRVNNIKQFREVEKLLLADGYYWASNRNKDDGLNDDEAIKANSILIDYDKNIKQLLFSSRENDSYDYDFYKNVFGYDQFLLSKGISGKNDKKVLVIVKGDKSKLQLILDHFRSVSDLPDIKDHEILQIVLLNNEVKSIGTLSWYKEKDPNIDFYIKDAVVEADDFIKNNITKQEEAKEEEKMKKVIKLATNDFDFVNSLSDDVNDSPFTGYTFINELKYDDEKIEHLSEILDSLADGELEKLLINYIMGDGDELELVRQELYIVRSANKDEDGDYAYLSNLNGPTYSRVNARKFTSRESANEKTGAFGIVETL